MNSSQDYSTLMPILKQPTEGLRPIHLLHCGISPLPKRACDAMDQYRREVESDPIATFGARLKVVAETRKEAATLLGTESENIAFIKSTTHGLLLMAHSIRWNQGDVIIVEESTFPANYYTWKALEEKFGVKIIFWPERNYRYELEDLEKLLKEHNPRLVSISSADYGSGFRHDDQAVGKLVKQHGAYFGIDGIQTVGCSPLDVSKNQADFLSADGHKWMLGPEGTGILYVNPKFIPELDDSHAGWIGRKNFMDLQNRNLPAEETARRFEEGALNFPGIVALGGSLSVINEVGIERVWDETWRNRMIVQKWGESKGFELVSPKEKEHSIGTISFKYPGDLDQLVKKASEQKVYISKRRDFLRIAPHFYQPTKMIEEALDRIELFVEI